MGREESDGDAWAGRRRSLSSERPLPVSATVRLTATPHLPPLGTKLRIKTDKPIALSENI